MTESNEEPSRRAVLLGAGAAGVAGLLAACGSGDTPTTAPPATTPPATTNPNPNAAASPSANGGATTAAEDPNAIKAADIPVGGGAIFANRRVVVTQPTAGTFKAFDATCTHQGCLVTEVNGGTITCACHGSQYKVADGSVVRGPATRALTPKTATLNGTTITVS